MVLGTIILGLAIGNNNSYNSGYSRGYSIGKSEGYNEGHNVGYKAAKFEGKTEIESLQKENTDIIQNYESKITALREDYENKTTALHQDYKIQILVARREEYLRGQTEMRDRIQKQIDTTARNNAAKGDWNAPVHSVKK
jgi:flagellar biosynthesis/type III secretory pathway protein FliH